MASVSMLRRLSTTLFTSSGRSEPVVCLLSKRLQPSKLCILKTTTLPDIFVRPMQMSTSYKLKKKLDTEVADDLKVEYSPDLVKELVEKMEGDLPLKDMPNPYTKERKKCLLCKHDVELDYKNTRLLSQFVSPFTGRIYGRKITGLCIPMQQRVSKLIKRSRKCGFMPFIIKDASYLQDPKLFDPFKPTR
ncbi:uncharacterized protein LOC121384259 [Gigantopelta aegis]|uniref:uncharacterized protein LOC121384259 n=1 Tax=Gigantopelta aegis TaxID=1735272 RepID=UPI001B88DAB1|nr:uncharacterized protein LOC121384259 [Gigantopelta aegis]